MNYKHIYHAGNFADVFKHITLTICLEKLHEKDAAFFVLDTHAGIGKYNLASEEASKTGEALEGVVKFLKNCDLNNPLIANYLKILMKLNGGKLPEFSAKNSATSPQDSHVNFANFFSKNPLKFYPGSPYIIKYFLRNQDHAALCEMRREEFLQLKRNFVGDKKTFYFNEDGFALLKSKLPPIEKRGLILIDPAFEKNSDSISKDYEKIITAAEEGLKRFAHGIYLIWYPIINKENEQKTLQNFFLQMMNLKTEKIVQINFESGANAPDKMNACGMFIINAPWQMEEKLSQIFGKNLKVNSR